MGIVKAVCISPARGTEKQNVNRVRLVENSGLENDAHAGSWHRQVSLLSAEKVDEFNEKGGQAGMGAFGENLLVSGIDFASLPVGTWLRSNDVILEITQIGKECHTHCAIYHRVGDCIMPREGVFARVIHGGEISVGDEILVTDHPGQKLSAAVITLSDQGAAGKREDRSGPVAVEMLEEAGYQVEETLLLPDEPALLQKALIRLADQRQISLILTTGGTGFSPRDTTPEATRAVIEREAPGIAEAIRMESMKITPRAMLSRGIAGIRKQSLIVNLPGSPKAVRESLAVFLDVVEHGLRVLKQQESECAR